MARTDGERDFQNELQYHRREWRVQRIGWIAMALIIVAALLGVFGSGPLSQAELSVAASARMNYERYARYGSQSTIIVECLAPECATSPLRVTVNASYFEAFELVSVTPDPQLVSAAGNSTRFEFDAAAAPARVIFRLEARGLGRVPGTWQIGDAEPLTARQFVYP